MKKLIVAGYTIAIGIIAVSIGVTTVADIKRSKKIFDLYEKETEFYNMKIAELKQDKEVKENA